MTDGAKLKCPFCDDELLKGHVTCGCRVECFTRALEEKLIVQRDETPEEEAEDDAWLAERHRDNEEHTRWLIAQQEAQ